MWKLLRNLLLAGALLAGAVKLLAWYEVGQDARRLSAALGPAAQFTYGGISTGLNGQVTLSGVALAVKRGNATQTFRADRLVFEAPNVFWLLKHALFAEDSWPAHFGIALEGMKLPGSAALDPHWFDASTLVPFQNAGCPAAAFSAADFRKMEVVPGDSQQHGEFRYDAEGKSLEATLIFIAPQTASVTLSADLRQFEPKMLRSEDALRKLQISQISVQYDDPGFLRRRNAFCAQRAGVSPGQFVEQHLAAVQDLLQQQGIEPGAEVLKLYRRLVENGGRASLLSLPSNSLAAGAWFTTPRDELLRQLNMTARYGDAPPVMFRLSFAAPPPPADGAVAAEAPTPVPATTAATTPTATPSTPAPAAVPVQAPPTATIAATATPPVAAVKSVQSATTPSAPPVPVPTPTPTTKLSSATVPSVAPAMTTATSPPKTPDSLAPTPKPVHNANGLEEIDRAEAKLAPPAATPKRSSAPAPELIASEAPPPPNSTLALVWKPTIERLPAAVPERPDYDVIEFAALNGYGGRFVRLVTDGGKKVEGYVVSANEAEVELRIREGGGSARFTVPKARIQQIQLVRRSAPPA